jgi:hypothetical protein
VKRALFALLAFSLVGLAFGQSPAKIRITTWNLEWFPNGSPHDATPGDEKWGQVRLTPFAEKPSVHEVFKRSHPRHAAAIHHAYTYSMCAVAAERYMRQNAEPSELASLVVENNDNSQKAIKLVHSLMRSKNLDETPPGCIGSTRMSPVTQLDNFLSRSASASHFATNDITNEPGQTLFRAATISLHNRYVNVAFLSPPRTVSRRTPRIYNVPKR